MELEKTTKPESDYASFGPSDSLIRAWMLGICLDYNGFNDFQGCPQESSKNIRILKNKIKAVSEYGALGSSDSLIRACSLTRDFEKRWEYTK